MRAFRYLSIPVVGFLLWLSIQPVETRWASADILLLLGTATIALVAGTLWAAPRIGSYTNPQRGRWSLSDVFVGIWGLYYVVRTWMHGDSPCATPFLKTIEILLLYGALRTLFALKCPSAKWLMGGLIICGIYEVALGMTQLYGGTSRHYLYPLTGTFQNPGPYAAFLLVGIIVSLTWMQEVEKGWQKKVLLTTTSIMLILLPTTWSRAALLALVAMLLMMYRRQYWRWRWHVWTGVIVLCVVFYLMKQGSADGRLLTWTAALTTWSHQPWLGVGTGGFQRAVADGVSEIFVSHPSSALFAAGGVTEYAFNDLLKVLVEHGVVGAVIYIALVGYVLILLWRYNKPLFYGALSLVIFSMFSYPFELQPFRIIMALLAAWAASRPTTSKSVSRSHVWMGGSLLLLLATYSVTLEVERLRQADRAYGTFAGIDHEAFIKDYYELLPLERDNARFLFDFGKLLRQHGRYNDSNDMFRQGAALSADPMFHVLMGNNYKDMGFVDLAEQSYKQAFSVMPNRLYPLYQLMKLYQEDDKTKAAEYARRIITFKEKVISPATKQMKEEAAELLSKEEVKTRYNLQKNIKSE